MEANRERRLVLKEEKKAAAEAARKLTFAGEHDQTVAASRVEFLSFLSTPSLQSLLSGFVWCPGAGCREAGSRR